MALRWNPGTLRQGDHVGVLVTQSEFLIFRNGTTVVKMGDKLPGSDAPLFAVVDLMGRVSGVSMVPDAAPPKAMVLSRFNPQFVSDQVRLSPDGRSVKHTDLVQDQGFGVVFGDNPLALFNRGCAYFEVRVDAVRKGSPDGLVIGITTDFPTMDDPVAETADDVAASWSLGFDGKQACVQQRGNPDLLNTNWNPKDMRVGDHAGLLIGNDGQMLAVVHNGNPDDARVVARGPKKVPFGGPFYALVDLLGNTAGVSLVRDARPPELAMVSLKLNHGKGTAAGMFDAW
jgi:hypothetical protein